MSKITLILLSMLMAASASISANAQEVASKFDTKLPIEISSDSLEVLQQQNQAIFTGNVIAVQGTVRLKSDVMVVHYTQKKGEGAPAAPTPAPAPKPTAPGAAAPASADNPMGAITRIDVSGHVFVATPEESAQGDKGDYDVAIKTIHLFGTNVVLTRAKNILRGTALEYNLETGRSLLTNQNGGVSDTTGKTAGGRVRGVFVPEDSKKDTKKDTQASSPDATEDNKK